MVNNGLVMDNGWVSEVIWVERGYYIRKSK